MSAEEILQRHAAAISKYLAESLEREREIPARLRESIAYSLLAPGKRLRPALVFESFHSSGGNAADNSVFAAAGAIELIHTFSLVHDDLPAMDDDDLRRGKPTNHKVFGEALAILAGDAMVTMAFDLIARAAEPDVAPKLIAELAHAAGPAGMIGGQALDIAAENQSLSLDDLTRIHRMKTAALIVAACRMGGIAARASDEHLTALTNYAQHIGLAFQIVDDLLDLTATPQQLGKQTRKDAARGKRTYPALTNLETARAAAHEHLRAAIDALQPFGASAQSLIAIARFIVERQS